MNLDKKEMGMIVGGVATVVTIVSGGVYYLVKKTHKDKKKSVNEELKKRLEIVAKTHWMKEESKAARLWIYEWLKTNEAAMSELGPEIEVISKEHWMSSKHKEAFQKISDWLWNHM